MLLLFRFTHWLQCCFVDWPQWPGHQWRLAVGRLLTTQVSQLGARLACKNSSSFSVFLKLEVSVIFLFLNVYFLQMAEKKCMLVFSSVLSSNTCLAALWCNHSIWAWEYFGIDTLEISNFLKSLSLLLIFRTAKSRWREELCCNKNWVIRSLAKPRLFSCSSVCLQEKTQRHPWPLHHWFVFLCFLMQTVIPHWKSPTLMGFISLVTQIRGQMMRNMSVMWAGRPSRLVAISLLQRKLTGIQLRKRARKWRPTWLASTLYLSWSSSYVTWRKVCFLVGFFLLLLFFIVLYYFLSKSKMNQS